MESRGLRKEIISETHRSPYTVHPGGIKMYQDMKGLYWWNNIKWDIARFVEQCSTCKICGVVLNLSTSEGRALEASGDAQAIASTKWKRDEIAMDFILGLPKTPTREDWCTNLLVLAITRTVYSVEV
jgi:hypothetical protein